MTKNNQNHNTGPGDLPEQRQQPSSCPTPPPPATPPNTPAAQAAPAVILDPTLAELAILASGNAPQTTTNTNTAFSNPNLAAGDSTRVLVITDPATRRDNISRMNPEARRRYVNEDGKTTPFDGEKMIAKK